MSQYRFGIFLPVRNGSRYIRETINSIVQQKYKNWVLIVLDNDSLDDTVKVANDYKNYNIKIYQTTLTLSISDSWHRIWQLLADDSVKVDFATIIGHDDILLPNFLLTISRLISDQPGASLYQTGFDMIDKKGNIIRPCRPIPARESSEEFLAARFWGLRDSVGTGYVFRSSDYVKVGGIPKLPSLLYADDLLFIRLAALSYKAAVSDTAFLYRLHRSSASNQITCERINNQIIALTKYIKILDIEFTLFMHSRLGKIALANLLSREIMTIAPVVRNFQFNKKINILTKNLQILYLNYSEEINYQAFLGSNFITTNIYIFSKRLMYSLIFLINNIKIFLNYFIYYSFKKKNQK